MGPIRHFLAAILVCTSAVAAAEPAMVIDARGPSAGLFPRGKMLASAFSVTLAPRDRLIVADRKGTRVFSGPGLVAIDRETDAPSRWEDIRTMVIRSREHMKRRGRMKTGVLRGGLPPSTVVLEVPEGPREGLVTIEWPASNGNYCFDPDVGLIVRRAAIAGDTPYPAATFDISGPDMSVLSLRVPEGRALFLWPPSDLPGEGEEAIYRLASGTRVATFTLSAAPIEDLDPFELAQFLDDRRCNFALGMFADKADQLDLDD